MIYNYGVILSSSMNPSFKFILSRDLRDERRAKMRQSYSLSTFNRAKDQCEVDFLRVPNKKKTVKKVIWNSETKEFLGRTGESWGKFTI